MIVVFVIAVPYYATLNVKQPKFRRLSAGALVALVTWVVASVVFGLYVSGFSNYQKTYGVLAGVIVFLLWLWITNLGQKHRRAGRRHRSGTTDGRPLNLQ